MAVKTEVKEMVLHLTGRTERIEEHTGKICHPGFKVVMVIDDRTAETSMTEEVIVPTGATIMLHEVESVETMTDTIVHEGVVEAKAMIFSIIEDQEVVGEGSTMRHPIDSTKTDQNLIGKEGMPRDLFILATIRNIVTTSHKIKLVLL